MRLFVLALLLAGCGPTSLSVAAHQTNLRANVDSTAIVVHTSPRTVVTLTASPGGVLKDSQLTTNDGGDAVTDLSATAPGTITVTATAGGVSSSTTVVFIASTTLRFTTSPSNTQAQNLLRPVPVVVVEENGAVVTSSSAQISVAVTPGSCSASLDATSLSTVTASQGSASFFGLKISTPATGCTLTATSGSLGSAVSGAFDVL
jgi:hypothetical protein